MHDFYLKLKRAQHLKNGQISNQSCKGNKTLTLYFSIVISKEPLPQAMIFKDILQILVLILFLLKKSINGCMDGCSGLTCHQGQYHTTTLAGLNPSFNTDYKCLRFDNSNSGISSIPSGVLYGSTIIQIALNSAGLTTAAIGDDAFNQISSLQVLWLQENDLTIIKEPWFANLTELHTLKLQGNDIHLIESGSFKDLVNLSKLILNNNDLKEMPFEVFDPNNRPTYLGELTLSWNPWNCTCMLCWAKLGQGSWITFGETSQTLCHYPTSLYWNDWNTGPVTAGNIRIRIIISFSHNLVNEVHD